MSPSAVLVAVLLFSPLAAAAADLAGKVVAIADGDTLTLLVDKTQHRIRIDGIDAPERTQPYSQVSRQSLAELLLHKHVTAQCRKRDKYGRDVCKVVNGDDFDVGLAQIGRGLAWHFKRYESEQSPEDRALYARAEEDVRANKRGMWASSKPQIPPWEFRASKTIVEH